MKRRFSLPLQGVLFAGLLLVARGMYLVGRDAVRVAQSPAWPSVPGRVGWHADPDVRPTLGYYPDLAIVAYEYRVDGRAFTGQRIDFHRRSKWNQGDVRQFLEPVLRDPRVTVYYDPTAPEVAVLRPGGSNTANLSFLLLQTAFGALLAFVWFRGWRKSPAPAAGPPT